jgi:hypothetical protein
VFLSKWTEEYFVVCVRSVDVYDPTKASGYLCERVDVSIWLINRAVRLVFLIKAI